MKQQSNYFQLLSLRDDINRQTGNSIAFAFFHKTKITDFFQRNAIRLQVANEKLTDLLAKHVEVDDNNEPAKYEDEGKMKWNYKSPDDKKAFEEAYKELMNTSITIEI